MVISSEMSTSTPRATLNNILDGADNLPTSLRLEPKKREVLGAYLDSFGLRQTYENYSVFDITEFTLDPTFVGFERGYKGENNFKKLSEAHPVAKVIGYAAGQKAKR